MTEPRNLAQYFASFWKNEAIGAGSPLYAALCDIVANSPELLRLAGEAREGQPAPYMLFAAVHAVLEEHPVEPLAAYYPSIGGVLSPDEHLGACFTEFCDRWSKPLTTLLQTMLVQTNEVRRCAFLLPAFSYAWRESGRPLALVEVGPSAGLNLLFDRYRYDYGDALGVGDASSPVTIDAEVRGEMSPEQVAMPVVASRTGIDINPLDVRSSDDAAWLRALTWPEHHDRRALLVAAMDVVRSSNVNLLRGDAIDLLPGVFAELPEGETPCVFATFVLHQLSPDQRLAFRRTLEGLSLQRPFYFVVAGFSDFVGWKGNQPDASTFVMLARLDAGQVRYRALVHCHPHGRWLEYLHGSDWESHRTNGTTAYHAYVGEWF